MQAGVRHYPVPPLAGQHLEKPGREADLDLKPMYDAPHYKGSEKLKDMVALITGADSGIGRSVAVLFAREGADIAVVYLNEHDDAAETKRAVEKEGRRCILISGDVANPFASPSTGPSAAARPRIWKPPKIQVSQKLDSASDQSWPANQTTNYSRRTNAA